MGPAPRSYSSLMSDVFTPELGQGLFSNSSMLTYEVPPYVTSGLVALGEMIGHSRSKDAEEAWSLDPCNNVGPSANFQNEIFAMRSYCWCDGEVEGHDEGCPVNFETDDFRVSWYKHVRRGASCDRHLAAKEWQEIFARCAASLSDFTV